MNLSADQRLILLPLAALTAASAPARATVYLSIEEAQREMFGDLVMTAHPVQLNAEQIRAIEADSKVRVAASMLRAWKGADGSWFLLDAVIGKSELITYALGLKPDGKIKQVEVLEYREAHGGEIRYPQWRKQFRNKDHDDQVRLDDNIQGISGATLSCEHVTDGIRRLLATYALVLAAAG